MQDHPDQLAQFGTTPTPVGDSSPYAGMVVALATQHSKQDVIAPPFLRTLESVVVVPSAIDTDALGTFTGEIPRHGTPTEVCERKARLGLAATGHVLAVASEGSYGPHPAVPFVAVGREVMVFVDTERDLTITETLETLDTNFIGARCVSHIDDAGSWLRQIRYPSHGVIVRPNTSSDVSVITKKGVQADHELSAAISVAASQSADGLARLEPDMRAHMNPTRMRAIGELAEQLVERLATPCPVCHSPGFGKTSVAHGLPCELCLAPTELVDHEIHACGLCDYSTRVPRSDGLQHAASRDCHACNP